MSVIANKKALIARQEAARAKIQSRGRCAVVNVSCGTCGLASGAEQILEVMKTAVETSGLKVEFFRSGCMTFCYAEPTVSITLPDREPVTFGFVDEKRALALINDFIGKGEPVEGEIPVAYERVVL